MTIHDLFAFDCGDLPTPRQLPEGWRFEQRERDAEGVVLAWTAPRSAEPMGGRLTVYIEQCPIPPEKLPYPSRGRRIIGMHATARGYYMGVSVDRLDLYAVRATTPATTRCHYASRLLELLTFFPGIAGDGWRELKKQLAAEEATKGEVPHDC